MTGAGEPLTDTAREEAIRQAAEAMERHFAVWASEGCFAALGMAHRARMSMEALIRGRSPAMVRRLEIRRGLV